MRRAKSEKKKSKQQSEKKRKIAKEKDAKAERRERRADCGEQRTHSPTGFAKPQRRAISAIPVALSLRAAFPSYHSVVNVHRCMAGSVQDREQTTAAVLMTNSWFIVSNTAGSCTKSISAFSAPMPRVAWSVRWQCASAR
jgi:hypothetical protein